MVDRQDPVPLSESIAMLGSYESNLNGMEGPLSIWDGDDMTLEMVTDMDDGDVDEEVPLIWPLCLLILISL